MQHVSKSLLTLTCLIICLLAITLTSCRKGAFKFQSDVGIINPDTGESLEEINMAVGMGVPYDIAFFDPNGKISSFAETTEHVTQVIVTSEDPSIIEVDENCFIGKRLGSTNISYKILTEGFTEFSGKVPSHVVQNQVILRQFDGPVIDAQYAKIEIGNTSFAIASKFPKQDLTKSLFATFRKYDFSGTLLTVKAFGPLEPRLTSPLNQLIIDPNVQDIGSFVDHALTHHNDIYGWSVVGQIGAANIIFPEKGRELIFSKNDKNLSLKGAAINGFNADGSVLMSFFLGKQNFWLPNATENCIDGIDNNQNGKIDCFDPECENIAICFANELNGLTLDSYNNSIAQYDSPGTNVKIGIDPLSFTVAKTKSGMVGLFYLLSKFGDPQGSPQTPEAKFFAEPSKPLTIGDLTPICPNIFSPNHNSILGSETEIAVICYDESNERLLVTPTQKLALGSTLTVDDRVKLLGRPTGLFHNDKNLLIAYTDQNTRTTYLKFSTELGQFSEKIPLGTNITYLQILPTNCGHYVFVIERGPIIEASIFNPSNIAKNKPPFITTIPIFSAPMQISGFRNINSAIIGGRLYVIIVDSAGLYYAIY